VVVATDEALDGGRSLGLLVVRASDDGGVGGVQFYGMDDKPHGEPPADATARARLERSLKSKVARWSRRLRADGYRALIPLATADVDGAHDGSGVTLAVAVDENKPKSEVLIKDASSGAVLWRRKVVTYKDVGRCNGADDVYTARLTRAEAWFDPPSGRVLIDLVYVSAADTCDDPVVHLTGVLNRAAVHPPRGER
jgi:hypothetical protein